MNMNRHEILELLKERNIPYEITEHKAIFNMEEAGQVEMLYPKAEAKNLFLRDDKKRNWYLVTVKGNKKLYLRKFQEMHVTRRLSFASDHDLMKYLKLIPGAVTPFGLLNDETCTVQFFIDRDFIHETIGVHPNDNTASVWMNADDLILLIQEHGNPVTITEMKEN